MNWTLPYLKTSIPLGAGDEQSDRRVAETLVRLHRFRGEGYVEGRRFCTIREHHDSDVVAIGFVDDLTERILVGDPLARRVADTTLTLVKQILS